MDHIFLSESYEIFMPLWPVCGESRSLLRQGKIILRYLLLLVGFGDRYRARI